jgi:hypothetical protein
VRTHTYEIRNQNFISIFYSLVGVGNGCVELDALGLGLVECEQILSKRDECP